MNAALKALPSNLDQAYHGIVQRIIAQIEPVQRLAFGALAWVFHSTRPLTAPELQEALSVKLWYPTRNINNRSAIDKILHSCAGLVMKEGDETVRFANKSVHIYLTENLASITIPSELHIVKVCLTYLGFDDFNSDACHDTESLERRLKDYPLLGYAAVHWHEHITEAAINDEEILPRLETLAWSETKLDTMLQIWYARPRVRMIHSFEFPKSYPKHVTLLHVLCERGLGEIAQRFLVAHPNIDISPRDTWGRTALHVASRRGLLDVVKSLLVRDPSQVAVNDNEDVTPLHLAAEGGHSDVVKELLEYAKEHEVLALDIHGYTPLDRAVASMPAEPDSPRLILKKMVQILPEGGKFIVPDGGPLSRYTLLHQAAMLGYEEGVKWLLEGRADPNEGDNWGILPIHRAAACGYTQIVEIFLDGTGSWISEDGRTPLHFAAQYGRENVVHVLLARAAIDPDAIDSQGFTALHWAAAGGHLDTVKILLPATHIVFPAQVNVLSPFELAVLGFYPDVVDMFLSEEGTDIESLSLPKLWTDAISTYPITELFIMMPEWAAAQFARGRMDSGTAWLDLQVMFYLSNDSSSRLEEIEHPATCDHCKEKIRGYRYRCQFCNIHPHYDLCSKCYANLWNVPHQHPCFTEIPSCFL